MKKKKIIAGSMLGISIIAAGMTLASCDMELTPTYEVSTSTTPVTPTTTKVTISFNVNGGSAVKAQTINKGAKASKPANPTKSATTKDGVTTTYTFAGWYSDSALTKAYDFNAAVNGNITLYAKWTATTNQTFTVTFNTSGGTAIASQKIIKGSKVQRPDDPTKAADAQYTYAFVGWYKDEAYTTVFDFNSEVITANTTIYAKWSTLVNKYDVTWKNGDTVLKTEKVEYGKTPVYSGSTPKKAATAQYTYTFIGWTPEVDKVTKAITYTATFTSNVNSYKVRWVDYDDNELDINTVEYGKTPSYDGTNPTRAETAQYTYEFIGWTPTISPVTGNITYKATYRETTRKYTVSFYVNNVLEGSQEIEYGAKPTLPTAPTKEPSEEEQYTFAGWSSDGGTTKVTTATEFPDVYEAVRYDAEFDSEARQYTVKWQNEDGTEFHEDTSWTYDSSSMPIIVEVPTKTQTAQYSYAFKEWVYNLDTETGIIVATPDFTATVRKYTVIWMSGTTSLETDMNVEYGATPSFTGPEPTKASTPEFDYAFAGWFTAETGGEQVTAQTKVEGDATYYAQFTATKRKYAIKFVAENGTTELQTLQVEYGTVPVYSGPEQVKASDDRYSYTAGWTVDPVAVTGEATYILKFTPTLRQYTITYDLAGGTVATANPETYTYDDSKITLNNPTKNGYTFAGWTGTGLTDATTTVEITTNSSGNRTYTATWTAINYAITYDLAGGAVATANPTTYTIESDAITLNNPTKNGYTFAGWTGTDLDAATTSVTIAQGSTGARTYTANWTATEYSITLHLGGGATATANPTTYTIETADITLVNPTKNGYTFAGWKLGTGAGEDSAQQTVTIAHGSTGAKEYTATWTAINYDITLHLDGGATATANPTTYTIETADITLINPTKNGYTFAGWKEGDEQGTDPLQQNVTIISGSTGNKEYTAIWLEDYAITYILNGGTIASGENPVKYNVNTNDFTLINPTKNGYTFAGWTGTGLTDPTETVTVVKGSTGARTYTATWNAIEYDITLHLADGTTATANPTKYTIKTADFTLINPTKEGYTFAGWTGTGLSNATETVTIVTGTTGALEFTATYTAVDYPIVLHLADGTTATANPTKYTIETADITLVNPTKNGYTFAGWKLGTGTGEDSAQQTVTIAHGSTGAKEYTATWATVDYTITYDLTGGAETTNPTTYNIETATITLAQPTKEHYDFAGWTGTGLDAATMNVTIPLGSTGDRTYKATWTPKAYNITYTLNGGTETTNPVTYNIESEDIILAQPTKTDYEFAGWTYEGQTTPKKDVTITTGSTGDKSYTANWNAIITFNTDEATINIPETQKILINGTNKIARPANNPAKYGYEFDDWYLENDTNPYNFDTVVTTSLTLYAKWTLSQAYTVTFDSNEGSAVTEQTVMGGYTASEPVSPTRANKEFVGWFTKDGTNDDWGDQWNFTTDTVNADMTLYAKWDNVKYTVKFNSKGGSAVASQRVEINTKVTKPQDDPTRTGYEFVEWTLNSAAFDFATYEVTSDITLIAKWEVATFTVEFETNGGSTIDDMTDLEYDSQIVVANPTKTGYVFAGWYSDEQLTQEFDLEIESIQRDITLYAKWTIAKYVVQFDTAGGTAISSQQVEHGKAASKPTNNPTKAGYTFKGWFVSAEENAEEFDFASPITGATTIYAKWDEVSNTIDTNTSVVLGTSNTDLATAIGTDEIHNVVKYGKITFDGTNGNIHMYNATNMQFNAGAKISFEVNPGAIVTVKSYNDGHTITLSGEDAFTKYYSTKTTVEIVGTSNGYLEGISITYLTTISQATDIKFGTIDSNIDSLKTQNLINVSATVVNHNGNDAMVYGGSISFVVDKNATVTVYGNNSIDYIVNGTPVSGTGLNYDQAQKEIILADGGLVTIDCNTTGANAGQNYFYYILVRYNDN